ncbi:MAG: pentapeptide repeat-containing protein [Cyanobacteria bacterium P01_A01_bin.83]
MTTKILVLASNPQGTEKLQLNPEIRAIKEAHERSVKREEFAVAYEPATRVGDLQRIISKEKPRIVHFCGHGTGHRGLVLENDEGETQLVNTEALTNLLKIFNRRIECVVLNACHTKVQGEQIQQQINFLIATQKEIRDDAALLFTKGFYDALFNGETYRDAYELGCNKIHLELGESKSSGRKLVPVYSESQDDYVYLEQHEIFLFLEKDPPNSILPDREPYQGLRSFGQDDAEFFFGRDDFIEQLYKATKINNFIPVLGASGSGKSSVVLAGLVPKLEQEDNWKFAYFRPGDEPFHALTKALLPYYMPELDRNDRLEKSREIANGLAHKIFPLKDVFAEIESNFPNYRVLLIADQFEELFTLYPDDKVQSFLDLLLTCFPDTPANLQQSPMLVATMRADFLGEALAYSSLGDVLEKNIKLLRSMKRQELIEVVEKPAEILEVKFEPGLAGKIVDDVGKEPGNLALLQFALKELWEKRENKQLTYKAYEKIGNVEGALAKYAEDEYKKLSATEQEQAQQIFLRLVNPNKGNRYTKKIATRNQIGEANWNLVTQNKGLADSRLVVTNLSDDKKETLEIVHDALIINWPRLQEWLNRNRVNLDRLLEIENAAEEWEKSDKSSAYLLSDKRLRSAKEFQKEQQVNYPLSPLANSFIDSSKKQQRNQRIKSLGVFLIVPLIGTAIGAPFVVKKINLDSDKKLIQNCSGTEFCASRIQALERLVEANEDLFRYNLEGANLANAKLNGANLKEANLKEAYLYSVKLNNANLKEANLYNANLEHAVLSSAFLEVTNLNYVNLEHAVLSNANLSGAGLIGSNLEHAVLSDANLRNAVLIDSNLIASYLKGANFQHANLRGATLSDANLESTNLNGANLKFSILVRSNLKEANLRDANLEGAVLYDANFSSANLESTNLNGANLTKVRNLTFSQIKSACGWNKAIYNAREVLERTNTKEKKFQWKWIIDEITNQQYIEKLKQDRASDPKEKVDCSRWK